MQSMSSATWMSRLQVSTGLLLAVLLLGLSGVTACGSVKGKMVKMILGDQTSPPPPKVLDAERLTPPSGPYELLEEPKHPNVVMYVNPELGNTIFANATCGQCEELSDSRQLSRNLLFPIDERELVSEEWETVAGQKSLHRVVRGVFEGAPVFVDSYVLTTDPCVFDLVYVARVERYERDLDAFHKFVSDFVIQLPKPELGLKPTAACIKRSP